MDATQFTYWLKGFLEISEETTLDTRQLNIVRDHLDLVFNKVTPDYPKCIENALKNTSITDYNLTPSFRTDWIVDASKPIC